MKGNTGKIIHINLSDNSIETVGFPAAYYSKYIGGSGLAAKIFWEKANFDAAPLSPEAMLVLMNGPFAGLKMSGTSRFCVAGRSPVTGGFADSSCGGYFAPELRYAGFDGMMIVGKSKTPVFLLVEDDKIELLDAGPYWGKAIEETTRSLKDRFSKKHRTLVIGPAGENQVTYANIMHDNHHALGRTGFGAVMGSKFLKAIVVNASKKQMALADPEGYEALRKTMNPKIRKGMIPEVLRDFGTAGSLENHVYSGNVPIKNWTSNFDEEKAEALTGETLSDTFLAGRSSCAYCGIACKRIVQVKEGPFSIPKGPGPEYETIVSFGCLLDSGDLAAACKAGRICNDLGMDTISCGATIAWAMEAFERQDLTTKETEGLCLEWADMATVVDVLLPAIALKKGKLGKLLGLGSVAAAQQIGRNSIDYTAHSKGLEAPMHDPRGGGHGKALAYALSPRGACHLSSIMHFVESGACYYPEIDFDYDLEPMTDEKKPEVAVFAFEMGNIENSACFCQFAARQVTLPEWIGLFNCVAGYNWKIKDMMTAGRRIFYLKRLLNYRFGFSAKEDSLTPRMLEPARNGEPEGIKMNFSGMKDEFYSRVGFDKTQGIPLKSILEKLDMVGESELVWTGNQTI